MTQVSKYRLSEDIKNQIESYFNLTIANLTTKNQVQQFFNEFLTKTEKIMFAKRLAIGILVSRGYEYRQISQILKVSTTTVSSFAFVYKNSEKYKNIVDGINKKIESKKELLDIAEGFASIGAIGGAKSAGWFTTRNEIRKKKNSLL